MMETKKQQPVFIASSYPEFLFSVFCRLLFFAGIIYCGLHFGENPDVLGTLGVILFLLLMVTGHDQIWIYDEKIVEKSDSLVSLLFRWRHKQIFIKDIVRASLAPEQTIPTSEKIYLFLLSILFQRRPGRQIFHPILFEMKNGDTRHLKTDTSLAQRIKIVEVVNGIIERQRKRR
jgi:hypothetical protein